MVELINKIVNKSIGIALWHLLRSDEDLTNKELVINSNSSNTQTIFLGSMKRIEIYDESVLFYGESGINDFLNLKNVLSISIVGEF